MKTRSMVTETSKRKQYLDNESPLCKELLLSKPSLTSEQSSQSYSDVDTPTQSMSLVESESSRSYQKIELTIPAADLRKNFDEFQKGVSDLEPYAANFLQGLKKHLQFKIQQVCSPQDLLEYFEPILCKLAKNPKQVRKNWSETETLLLVNIIIYYCLWREEEAHALSDEGYRYIASIYPGKREDQIKLRWQSILKVTLSKAPWTKEEDGILTAIVQEKGPHRWKNVAMELARRSQSAFLRQGKQCRERWINHLDPKLRKGSWDDVEDLKLLHLLIDLGKKWAEIAKRLGGRTENNVKNRWISLLRRYRVPLENDPPTLSSDDQNDCIEQNFARAILRAKNNEHSNFSIKNKEALLEPQSAKVKAEDDGTSFGEGSNDASSNSDAASKPVLSKTANSSPVKNRKVLRTSKKIAENLAKNLEKKELTRNSTKVSQLKYLNSNFPMLANSLAKVEWEMDVSASPHQSLLVPSLLFNTADPEGKQQSNKEIMEANNRSFDLLAQQLKQLPLLLDLPKDPNTHVEYDHDFIRYPCGDEDLPMRIPTFSRRSSAAIYPDPSPRNNSTFNMMSRGLANAELFAMRAGAAENAHPDDYKVPESCVRGLNEMDFFYPSLSTELPSSHESLDNHSSRLLLKPSIVRRRMSIEQCMPPLQQNHHDQHDMGAHLDASHRKQNAGDQYHQNPYLFQPLVTKKDTLFMIDEPIEEHYEEPPHYNVDNAMLYQPKHEDYMQGWQFRYNDLNRYNLNFMKNASEQSRTFDGKF